MVSDKTFYMLAASFIRGIGPKKLKKLSEMLLNSNINETDVYKKIEFVSSHSKKINFSWKVFSEVLTQADKQMILSKSNNISIYSSCDPCYPYILKESTYDPSIIYIRGNVDALNKRSIGVIGTRVPTDHGAVIAYRIAKYLAEHGITVVSGLALGCDTYGHNGALDAGGYTIAVMAHGLDMVAPFQNKDLAEKIINNEGALVSTYPIGTKPSVYTFAARDKIQAGLSEMIVMVQSGLDGGSLIASGSILFDNKILVIPAPTKTDKKNNCEQIQANLLFINSQDENDFCKIKKFNFMKILSDALKKKIVILNGKEDYIKIFGV